MEPLPDPSFWQVIDASKKSLRKLCRQLERMTKEELISYQRQYEDAKSLVNPIYREDFHSFADENWECSEDGADDFAAWVVMRGKPFFEKLLDDPPLLFAQAKAFEEADDDDLAETQWDEEVDRPEYRGYQRADYVANLLMASKVKRAHAGR